MELRIGDSVEYRDERTGQWHAGTIARLAEVQWSDAHVPNRVRLEEADTEDYGKGRLRATLDGGRILQLGGRLPIDQVRPCTPFAQAAK